jgi:hypothetical protein
METIMTTKVTKAARAYFKSIGGDLPTPLTKTNKATAANRKRIMDAIITLGELGVVNWSTANGRYLNAEIVFQLDVEKPSLTVAVGPPEFSIITEDRNVSIKLTDDESYLLHIDHYTDLKNGVTGDEVQAQFAKAAVAGN